MRAHLRKILKSYNVILASASKRRIELIKQIPNLEVTVIPSFAKEECKFLLPQEIVVALAQLKAGEVFSRFSDSVVIGADTVVAIDGEILGKPKSEKEAENMIRKLSARQHEVYTGVCIMSKEKIIKNFEKSCVKFGAFNDKIVYNYIKLGRCLDYAGAYGLQDPEFAPMIESIWGSRDNIIGLPVNLVQNMLKEIF